MAKATVLRIRPYNLKNDGLLRAELTTLSRRFAGTRTTRFQKYYFHPDLPQDGDQVHALAERLADIFSTNSHVVIDLGYRQVERRTFNFVLAGALAMSRATVDEPPRILVLLDSFLKDADPIMAEFKGEPWNGIVRVADSTGAILQNEESWELPAQLAELCQMSNESKVKVLQRRLIRCRGVFQDAVEQNSEYEGFRYYGDHATDVVADLFHSFLGNHLWDAVLIPDDVSPWFARAVTQVVVENYPQKPVLTPAQMRSPDAEISAAVDALRAASTPTICVAIPVYRYGRSLAKLASAATSNLQSPRFLNFSVMAQESLGRSRVVDGVRQRQIKDSDYTLNHFLPIPAVGMSADSWQVKAAHALNEIQLVPAEWSFPTTSAMWALFDFIKFGLETPYSDTSRPRLAHFPRLSNMDEEDAKWLAYALLRHIVADEEDVLVVVPAERSGALPLAEAFERCLDVAVATVPRSVIKSGRRLGPKPRALIEDYADRHIAICDESFIGGGTIASLDRLIRDVRGRGADQVLVAIDAPVRAPALKYRSLYSWTPLLIAKD